MANQNRLSSKNRLDGSQIGRVIRVISGTSSYVDFDDEPPPLDILEEIEAEFGQGEESLEVCLESPSIGREVRPSYGEEMVICAMTALRKFTYAKKVYTIKIGESKKRALARLNSKTEGHLTNDAEYIAERLEAKIELQKKIDDLSLLLLKPEQIPSMEKPLTGINIHTLSEAYHALMFTENYLPFKPIRNWYLMRVKKSIPLEKTLNRFDEHGYGTNGRAVLVAGLSMINYYSGQEIKVPYPIHLFEGHDAIRMVGVIMGYTTKRGVVEFNDIESCARWYWPEVIFSLNHHNLLVEDKNYIRFLICHMLARLIFTDVLEGHLKLIKTANNTYQTGLYFTVGQKYLKNNKTFKYT